MKIAECQYGAQKGTLASMHVEPADELADYFDTAVAAALREWADSCGGTVRLPSSGWRAKGYTGAELAAIVLDLPGPGSQKIIVKIHPGGRYARETGRHEEAIAKSPRAFADRHLVKQLYPRHPVRDGRFLMFQDIAGGSFRDSHPLSELPAEDRVRVCGQVARALLEDWNPGAQQTQRTTAAAYVAAELKDLDEDGSAWRWGKANGLLDRGGDSITMIEDSRAMPNPYRFATEESVANTVTIDYLYGRSHGDLHLDNVLVLRRPSERLQPKEFRLIDLSGYSPSAPLTRDPVMLMLSVISKDVPKSRDQRDALIDFVITPRSPKQAPYELTRALRDAVRTIYDPGLRWAGSWSDEWRAQYLLSVLSTALLYTSFDSVDMEGRWWFLCLAARASDAFLKAWGSSPPPSAVPRRVAPPSAAPDDRGAIVVVPEDPPVKDPQATVTRDPRSALPEDLSSLHEILIRLYPDYESARSVVLRLPKAIQYPTFENVEDVWAAILQEASKMELISILDIINNEELYADKPNLIRAARRCQQRWKPDFGAIVELATTYRADLNDISAGQKSRSSDEDDDCIEQTIDLRELLCTLIIEVEKPFRWWAAVQDDFDDRAITDLLSRSLDLLDLLREGGTSPYRRRQLLGELRRLSDELVRMLDGLDAADA